MLTKNERLCSRSFKLILQRLENETLSGIPISSTLQESKELVSLRTVYSMSGFPMNSSYTDLNALLTMVHNTDIHTKADKGIEFALAVHCVGYPGKFVSVWIYLASLNKAF